MLFLIYKTTNQVNGKFYIGQHAAEDLDFKYLGSGKNFKRALRKYGSENFVREILFNFPTFEEMNEKEKELVTEDLVKDPYCYNLTPGGFGGSRIKGKIWINDGIIDRYWNPDSLIPMGWSKGRCSGAFTDKKIQAELSSRSDRNKAAISIGKAWKRGCFKNRKTGCSGDLNPSKRPEVRDKMRQAKLDAEDAICPYCNKIGRPSAGMFRFHFDRCKKRPE